MSEVSEHTESTQTGPGGDGQARPPDGSAAPTKRKRRWLWRALLLLIGVPLGLVLLVLLVLQTPVGAGMVKDIAVDRVSAILDGAHLEVDELDGTFVHRLGIYGVRLVSDEGTVLAEVDTVAVRYNPLQLLQRTVAITDAVVAGPTVQMQQQADSTWNLLNVLPSADTTEVDTTASAWQIRLESVRLSDGGATVSFYNSDRDSLLRVERLDARLHELTAGTAFTLHADTLALLFVPPDAPSAVRLAVGDTRLDETVAVDGFTLASARSDVAGSVRMRLPSDTLAVPTDVRATLRAAPLAFDDLRPFAPMLAAGKTLTADLDVTDEDQQLVAALDAAFDGGGTIRLDARGTPPRVEPLRYAGTAEVRAIDPAWFAADALQGTTPLDADLRFDLQGPAVDALSGRIRLTVNDAQFSDLAVGPTNLEAILTDGRTRLDLTTAAAGATLAVRGTARPLAETPTYDLQGEVSGLNLARVTGNDSLQSDLNATFSAQGRGFAADEAQGRYTLALGTSRFQDLRLTDARLDATLDGGTVQADLAAATSAGDASVQGRVTLGEQLRYAVTEGRLSNLDLAALTGDTTQSALSGQFQLNGRGTALEAMTLDASVQLDTSRYGSYRLQAGSADLRLDRGRLTADVSADLVGGAADLRLTGRPFAAEPSFDVTEANFRNLDVGALTANPALATDLTGSASAQVRGTTPETLRLRAAVSLDASRINDQPIDAAELSLDLNQGPSSFALNLDTPEGFLSLAGDADLFAETATFDLQEGRFEDLRLGQLLGSEALTTSLTGSLAASGAGLAPGTMQLDVRLTLAPSALNDATIEDAALTLALDDGFLRADGNVDFAEGSAELAARGRLFDDVPTYELSADARNLDLAALAGIDTTTAALTFAFTADGRGLDPTTMEAQGTLSVSRLVFDEIRVDSLEADLALNDGYARVDTLLLRANVADAVGGGAFALQDTAATRRSDFRFRADVKDLTPVRPLLGADVLSAREGVVEGRLFGPPGTLRFDIRAAFNSLAYNTFRIADLLAEAQGEFDADRTLQTAELNTSFDYFSIPNVVVERSELRATYADSSVTFDSNFQLDERRDARVAGAVDLRLGQSQVQVDDFSFRFDDDQWQLLQAASVSYGDEYRISNLLLYAESSDLTQQIALDGVVDFDGRQSLILTIEDFRINTVADLIGFDGLGGQLNGFVDLTGPAEAPQLSGTLGLDVTSSGRDVGTLDLELGYDSLRLAIDARLAHDAGGTLEAGGALPIDLRLTTQSAQTGQQGLEVATASIADDPVDLYLRTDRFDIGWVEPFLDPATVNNVDGILEADLGVRGTFQAPELVGEAALSDGLVGMPILGTSYRGIEARVSTDGDQLVIDQARLRSGGGTLNATGTVSLTDLSVGQFDLQLDGERFLAIDNTEYRLVVDTDLALRGTTQEPVLNGAADVISGDIYLVSETINADALVVELTDEDLQKLEERFGIRITEADTSTFSFYQALEMDVDVSIERDTWVRSRETPTMDIQFTGDLDVSKDPFADPQVFGVIEVVPERSRVEALGKIFGLETGTLTFNGAAFNPRLDITAEYTVPNDQVVIVLAIDDRPVDDLRIELSSENPPGLDQTQIVSYLLFGKPPGETFFLGGGGDGEGGGLFQQGSQLAIGQLAGFLEGLAGQQLGLDVIEIKTDAFTGETQLTAGRYFQVPGPCQTFYAAIDQTISTGTSGTLGSNIEETTTQVTLECELQQWLLVRLRGPGSMEVNLRWRYAY